MIIRNHGKVVERMVEAGERDLEHLLLHIIIVHVNIMVQWGGWGKSEGASFFLAGLGFKLTTSTAIWL